MAELPENLTSILARREMTRQEAFRTYTDLRRQAQDSEDYELHRLVGEAYQGFMRSFLDDEQRRFLELEDENIRLRAELQRWRSGTERRES